MADKVRILREADACGTKSGVESRHCCVGRESTRRTSATWRRQREAGQFGPFLRGSAVRWRRCQYPRDKQIAELERPATSHPVARAEQAERLVELPKSLAELLGDPAAGSREREVALQ